jgi:integrase/recombinase XerD
LLNLSKIQIKTTFSVEKLTGEVVFLLELEDVLEEYLYHCIAKGFTPKTMKNKRQEYKQLTYYLKEKRAIKELESITVYDLKAYIRQK